MVGGDLDQLVVVAGLGDDVESRREQHVDDACPQQAGIVGNDHTGRSPLRQWLPAHVEGRFGLGNSGQLDLAGRAEDDVVSAAQQVFDDVGHQDLARGGRLAQPAGDHHLGAEYVAAGAVSADVADVDPYSGSWTVGVDRCPSGGVLLHCDRRADGVVGGIERRDHAVGDRLGDVPAELADDVADSVEVRADVPRGGVGSRNGDVGDEDRRRRHAVTPAPGCGPWLCRR